MEIRGRGALSGVGQGVCGVVAVGPRAQGRKSSSMKGQIVCLGC